MRFMVEKNWDDVTPPCEGAVRAKYLRRDVRTVADPTLVPCFKDNPDLARREWYGKGQNHRVEDVGHGEQQIVRDVETEGWFVEVPDLEALVALCLSDPFGAIDGSSSVGGEPRLVLGAGLE